MQSERAELEYLGVFHRNRLVLRDVTAPHDMLPISLPPLPGAPSTPRELRLSPTVGIPRRKPDVCWGLQERLTRTARNRGRGTSRPCLVFNLLRAGPAWGASHPTRTRSKVLGRLPRISRCFFRSFSVGFCLRLFLLLFLLLLLLPLVASAV